MKDINYLKAVFNKTHTMLESCTLCPRQCRVNRLKGEFGFCKTTDKAKVYNFLPHFGEEPPISGTNGSGTIFFSGCSLSCAYCQNHAFSQTGEGREVEAEELAQYMLKLQGLKCHNINLVTPTHVLPQILDALGIAIENGLNIPIIYNTSGYELPKIIELLQGIVDVYLPDMRYAEEKNALTYSQAKNYCLNNQAAVIEMHRQVGEPEFDQDGIIKKGLIIRHLVLPNGISGTESLMRFIAKNLSPDTFISLMSQYLPCYKAADFKGLSRKITRKEYLQAEKAMEKYGLYNGWKQEGNGLEKLAGINLKPLL